MINKLYNILNQRYMLLIYLSIFSIFITPVKVYVPVFAVVIFISLIICMKEKINKIEIWQKILIFFLIWAVLNYFIHLFFYKDYSNLNLLIKFILNITYLISVSMVIPVKITKENFSWFIVLTEVVIIANFLQLIIIYINGNLFPDFFNGNLTNSSESAYVVSKFYTLIGAVSKNIWSTKLVFINIIYLYLISNKLVKLLNCKTIVTLLMGGITIILLLSRTGQVAILAAYVLFIFNNIFELNKKYRYVFYSICTLGIIIFMYIFFSKFFHLSFNMTDGGFVRLLIWKESLIALMNGNWILGNGFGSPARVIAEVLHRKESNFHNVLLNMAFELGIVGIGLYIGFLINFFRSQINKENIRLLVGNILIPMIIILSLQYIGYDNDIIILLVMILIVGMMTKKERNI